MMSELKLELKDKFAFFPTKVRTSLFVDTKCIWFKKYSELYINGKFYGIYDYDSIRDEALQNLILSTIAARNEDADMSSVKSRARKNFKHVLISETYFDKLCSNNELKDDVIYSVHKQNGPRQIIYVPTERAIYNVYGAEPGDLILEEIGTKMYKTYVVDIVSIRDKQVLHVTYQYISDGSRDTILF